jgi:heptosyltransferase-3
LPLPTLAAILEQTTFIGHDSGISHLAAAANAKSILLFGPTDPVIWAPLNENARVIRAPDKDLERLNVDLVRGALDQELMRIGIST